MAGTKQFDPLAYIENAFLDTRQGTAVLDRPAKANGDASTGGSEGPKHRFRKTRLSAPRPRRSKNGQAPNVLDPGLKDLLDALPRNIEFLGEFFTDQVTAHYYRNEFDEPRSELIRRLVDPELTLEEVSRLLGVCPATVRRYTNRSWLAHHRTKGGQRRFRLSGVVRFVEEHGRLPEA